MATADFLANLIANVGTGITPAAESAPDTDADVTAPAEIVHMMGFTSTDEIAVGGTITTIVSLDGFHGAYRTFTVTKVNRASVVVDMDGASVRIPIGRVIIYRAA